ncbi:MAG TPA: FecR domain-containing protein [Dissulfurispiraceae bacterium]|nr:FecR domain-containing protein [Dissulfurispiraceae bacterium]
MKRTSAHNRIARLFPGLYIITIIVLLSACLPSSLMADSDPMVEIVVSKGDALIKIARSYLDVTSGWKEIARVNKLRNPHLLYPGQRLLVPARLLRGTPMSGTLTNVKGHVEMRLGNSDTWQPATANERIPEGSFIRTGQDSAAEITFDNGEKLSMRELTHVGLETSRDKGDILTFRRFFLGSGKVVDRVMKATGKENRTEIRTPSATCAVRGTVFRGSVDAGQTSRFEVLDGSVNIMTGRQKIPVAQGEGIIVRKGEYPDRPIMLLPPPVLMEKRDMFKALPLHLVFRQVEGAAGYRLVVSRASAGQAVAAEKMAGPDASFKVDGIDDGPYTIESSSIDEIGLEGLPSEPVPIKVRVNPVPPYVESPAAGAEYAPGKLIARWLNVSNAAAYRFQIAEDPAFRKIIDDRGPVRGTSHVPGNLEPGNYHFRVCSVAKDGYEGAWSDPVQFTILPPPPAPSIDPPEMDGRTIRLRWQRLPDRITYRFQMSRHEDFSVVIMDERISEPEISFARPEEAGTYFVRTSAIAPGDNEGGFSSPQSFIVERKPYAIYGILGALFILLLTAL